MSSLKLVEKVAAALKTFPNLLKGACHNNLQFINKC